MRAGLVGLACFGTPRSSTFATKNAPPPFHNESMTDTQEIRNATWKSNLGAPGGGYVAVWLGNQEKQDLKIRYLI
jgi:hypothetical protein